MGQRFRVGVAGLTVAAALTAGAATAAASTSSSTTGHLVTAGALDVVQTAQRVHRLAADGSERGTIFGPVTRPARGWSKGAGVRVRSKPINGSIRVMLWPGERITVLCVTPGDLRDGYEWGRVRKSNGVSGWVRKDLFSWHGAAPSCF